MRVFHLNAINASNCSKISESAAWPETMPDTGYFWIAYSHSEFEAEQSHAQAALQRLINVQIMDLHVQDMLSTTLGSHYDYTSQYDVLVFRRLAPRTSETANHLQHPTEAMYKVDTSPVAFALFDRILLTVHPSDCQVRNAFATKLIALNNDAAANGETRLVTRMPTGTADLMLRLINTMVDGYLDLRRELTQQFERWQASLLAPRTRITNWQTLLDARGVLHHLDDICEDQRSAMVEWIDALEEWPTPDTDPGKRERDNLLVRSRDVLEHIERVVNHVHRLEQSAENAVQLHFSAVAHRTNDIMRTLTAITAVFLPLNLITGIFGMNFEGLPLIHNSKGFAWAIGMMVVIAAVVILFFWWKRYLRLTPSNR